MPFEEVGVPAFMRNHVLRWALGMRPGTGELIAQSRQLALVRGLPS